jgi:putative transposase
VRANQARYSVRTMFRLLDVSASGYYAWSTRPRSKRAQSDEELLVKIRSIHQISRGTYGAPRVHAELVAEGTQVNRKRVSRLMREAGLQGASRRRSLSTTVRERDRRPAPDLVERKFSAEQRDRLWVADITYIPTWSGFLYLSVVLDAWSRRVVGWSMATHLRTELVLEALNMALGQRRPTSVIHHSDQGTQYTSIAFGLRCREAGVRPSMGSVATASTTRCVRAFSRRSSVSCSIVASSRPRPRLDLRSSSFSRAGTTLAGGTRRSDT